jgi:hypothetical protein
LNRNVGAGAHDFAEEGVSEPELDTRGLATRGDESTALQTGGHFGREQVPDAADRYRFAHREHFESIAFDVVKGPDP